MSDPGTGTDGHHTAAEASSAPFIPPAWWVYTCSAEPHDGITRLPRAPEWRTFADETVDPSTLMDAPAFAEGSKGFRVRGRSRQAFAYQAEPDEIHLVNMAMLLRRPLLVTGSPGVGKTTLALSIARELGLGPVLRWSITSRSTLQDGQYRYDAIARLQDGGLNGQGMLQLADRATSAGVPLHEHLKQGVADPEPGGPAEQGADDGTRTGVLERVIPDIGRYLHLGPLGTAFLPWRYPRVLLIDEIDKGDVDLPNDLLGIFEEGEFVIPELARMDREDATVMTDDDTKATLYGGRVRCHDFPIVIMTSNGEREFPSAFMRRCIRLKIGPPSKEKLERLVAAHFPPARRNAPSPEERARIINKVLDGQTMGDEIANDQLLNAIQMTTHLPDGERELDATRKLIDKHILRPLNRD